MGINSLKLCISCLIIASFLFASCWSADTVRTTTKANIDSLKQVLKKKDLEFSNLSYNQGVKEAFLSFVAADGVMLRDNSMPTEGKTEIEKLYKNFSNDVSLTWKPLYADVAQSGELGYTYGLYTLTKNVTTDSTIVSRGTYVTVWKKQPDGSWKWALDCGTTGLPQE